MAILKMEGRTHDMLAKDKRVKGIEHLPDEKRVVVCLAEGWIGKGPGDTDRVLMGFDNWEAARNWVRKAKQTADA